MESRLSVPGDASVTRLKNGASRTPMRLLIATVLLVHALGCSRDDDRPLIEDKEAFVDLSVDEQSALVGDDKRLDQRIAELSDEIGSAPTAKAYSRRGAARVLKRQFDRAMSDFDAAIALDSGHAHAHYNRGVLYSQLLNHDLAIADYASAIEADAEYSLAYANRGMAHLELKHYRLAIADLRKAIDLDADDHLAMHALAVALFENPDRVESDIGTAERLATQAAN